LYGMYVTQPGRVCSHILPNHVECSYSNSHIFTSNGELCVRYCQGAALHHHGHTGSTSGELTANCGRLWPGSAATLCTNREVPPFKVTPHAHAQATPRTGEGLREIRTNIGTTNSGMTSPFAAVWRGRSLGTRQFSRTHDRIPCKQAESFNPHDHQPPQTVTHAGKANWAVVERNGFVFHKVLPKLLEGTGDISTGVRRQYQ
jgi:hypothetical protein